MLWCLQEGTLGGTSKQMSATLAQQPLGFKHWFTECFLISMFIKELTNSFFFFLIHHGFFVSIILTRSKDSSFSLTSPCLFLLFRLYHFLNVWLRWLFFVVPGLSPVAAIRGCSLDAVCRLVIEVASLVVEHGL